jgi:glutathione S-transferase
MIRLISATPSPFARKVRIALIEKAIPFELTTEVPWNSDTTLPTHNPLEKLPVLIPDDEEAVYDSRFILEWLEARYPTPAMFPADRETLLAARRIEVIADGVCDAVILTLFERQRAAPSGPWLARQRRKIDGGVAAWRLAAAAGASRWAMPSASPTSPPAARSAISRCAFLRKIGAPSIPSSSAMPRRFSHAPRSRPPSRRRRPCATRSSDGVGAACPRGSR